MLRLKVIAGASRPALAGLLGNRLKVRVVAPAQVGRANAAVRALIVSWLGCREPAIVSGGASAEKTVHLVRVEAFSAAQLAAAGLPCARGGKE